MLGKDKNAYAQRDFSSAYYQNRQLNFTVSTFNDPTSDRHGDPMVYMQNPGDGNYYSLGMFSQDSNKLPVSANFTAHAVRIGGVSWKQLPLLSEPCLSLSRHTATQVESRGAITLRPSLLDLYVRLSVHTAPETLSFDFCSCGCSRDKIRVLLQDCRDSNCYDFRLRDVDVL